MSYNREWDRGKDSWNDQSWNEYPSKGNVRGRDDEYYGEGKRRKYNNGGYDSAQNWDEGGYDNYNNQGRGNAQWSQQDHGDDRSHWNPHGGKKRQVPSEPSPHVIFLGLDPDFTEADLQAYLTNQGRTVETVTIIRDRSTGASKGFGFAQFASVEQARAFVDPHFPFIQVPPPASHGASATTAFYKALETGVPHNGRRVKIDFSQSASPSDRRRGPLNTNDGTRDIGNTQAPVLLFRGLDPLSGPQAIAQAMKNSSGFGKEGAKGMRRILLIKDKVTLGSWGFAFVEFVDNQSASAVLAATMSPQIHPAGFRISDKPVAASFAHPYSFQPLPDYSLRDDACVMGSTNLGGVEGTWVRYWDEASTVAQLEFKVEEQVEAQAATPAKDEKKKKKAKGDDHAQAAKPAEASELPLSDKPVTLSFKGGFGQKPGVAVVPTGPVKRSAPTTLGFSMADDDGAGDEDEGGEQNQAEDPKVAASKKVAPMIASKKIANNITKWNQVQEELKDGTAHAPAAGPVPVVVEPPPTVTVTVQPKAKSKSSTPVPPENEFEFSDTFAKTCLLCARQFKALDQLKRHNKESDLHKKNLKDANLRDVAREKVKAAKVKHDEQDQPKYRDRAAERRVMHNQPDIPMPESSSESANKRRHAEGPPPPPSPPPPPVNPGEDENNVGNKLLRMMGWQAGTGLGTDGDGRVEPVSTAIYAQGVGLGASKGKEIGKYGDGYSGYVHMAQDAARERYNN